MASPKPLQEGDLNDSWVELQMHQNPGVATRDSSGPTMEAPHQSTLYNENLEKLLIEAQRESASTSYANSKESSAKGSPKSPPSPTNTDWGSEEGKTKTDTTSSDWIWDWSSGPEIQQSGGWSERFRHPGVKPRRITAKSAMTKSGIFRLENLPTLLLTHACTFFLGAAVMFIYLKKYCHWTTVVSSALD